MLRQIHHGRVSAESDRDRQEESREEAKGKAENSVRSGESKIDEADRSLGNTEAERTDKGVLTITFGRSSRVSGGNGRSGRAGLNLLRDQFFTHAELP